MCIYYLQMCWRNPLCRVWKSKWSQNMRIYLIIIKYETKSTIPDTWIKAIEKNTSQKIRFYQCHCSENAWTIIERCLDYSLKCFSFCKHSFETRKHHIFYCFEKESCAWVSRRTATNVFLYSLQKKFIFNKICRSYTIVPFLEIC